MSEAEEQAPPPTVLICTVGGSDAPIRKAMMRLKPAAVWFLTSDGSNNSKSSLGEVTDAGKGLKFDPNCPADINIRSLPPDDPDAAYSLCRGYLRAARREHPDHRLVADYTGGTKSMTGALLMAAFAEEGVIVQFMAGERNNLNQVVPGSEEPRPMLADLVTADRDFAAAAQAVKSYDYAAARRILDDLRRRLVKSHRTPPADWRKRFELAYRWTGALAYWDAFHHPQAWNSVQAKDKSQDSVLRELADSGHLEPLQDLASSKKEPSWRVCADLWLNALRRGERGRYDDGVARLYRLVEAAAQTQLWQRHRRHSKAFPWDEVPDRLRFGLRPRCQNGREVVDLALHGTVKMLHHLDPSDEFVALYAESSLREGSFQGPGWLAARNSSILAHGFAPIEAGVWGGAKGWVQQNLARLWKDAEFPQLPNALPAGL